MLLGETCRRYPTHTAVRPDLVVVLAPTGRRTSGFAERLEPLFVEVLIAELAVEALDVAVLHRPPGLDQDVADAARLRPGHEDPAGEFRAVIGAYGQRVTPKPGRLIQHPGHVLARDAVVHGDLYALVAEVISHCQVLQAPAIGQAVRDEIHAPDLIDRAGKLLRHTLVDGALALLAPAHSQVGLAVEPVHPLVIDARELRAQQIVNTPLLCGRAHST